MEDDDKEAIKKILIEANPDPNVTSMTDKEMAKELKEIAEAIKKVKK